MQSQALRHPPWFFDFAGKGAASQKQQVQGTRLTKTRGEGQEGFGGGEKKASPMLRSQVQGCTDQRSEGDRLGQSSKVKVDRGMKPSYSGEPRLVGWLVEKKGRQVGREIGYWTLFCILCDSFSCFWLLLNCIQPYNPL